MFPRLVGCIREWKNHITRIKDMGFNSIYINPFHSTGGSNSLYAIKDYYSIDSSFFKDNNDCFEAFVEEATNNNLQVFVDLVVNHTANENSLIQQHPEWYRQNNGSIKHPGCLDNGNWVTWGDLAELETEYGNHIPALREYFLNYISNMLKKGVKGFRCDAAYKINPKMWEFLISETKKIKPDTIFMAETLGCSIEETKRTAEAGFDYIFNAFKWWDYSSPWFINDYNSLRFTTKSISFPESHDTERLCKESGNNIDIVVQKYLMSCLVSGSVMMPLGFEWGFRERCNVCCNQKMEWGQFNIENFIRNCNILKNSLKIFKDEAELIILNGYEGDILQIKKVYGNDIAYIIMNKTEHQQDYQILFEDNNINDFVDISIGSYNINVKEYYNLKPFEVKIFHKIIIEGEKQKR